jgi:hypothetical protein
MRSHRLCVTSRDYSESITVSNFVTRASRPSLYRAPSVVGILDHLVDQISISSPWHRSRPVCN